MNYDDWKTESPEDEYCRLHRLTRAERRALAFENGELDPDAMREEREEMRRDDL